MFVTRPRRRDEAGAAVLLIVLLASVLLMISALSVDLGNAWARKRAVQKQVDLAALRLGNLLPAANATEMQAVAGELERYLTTSGSRSNLVPGQSTTYTWTQFVDADPTNGELEFLDDDLGACDPRASQVCTAVRVWAPEASVDFGFARVAGHDGIEVSRSATVRVFSELPRNADMLPFWLPNGCAYGPAQADTAQGGGPKAATTSGGAFTMSVETTSPSPTPTTTTPPTPAAPAAPQVVISPVGTHRIGGPALSVASAGTRSVVDYVVTSVPANTDRASLRFVAPDGTTYIDFAVNESNPKGTLVVPPFTVGSSLTSTPGTWTVYALVKPNGKNSVTSYSANSLSFTVSAPSTPTASPTTSAPTSPAPTSPAPTTAPATTSPPVTESPTPTPAPTPAPEPTATATGIPVGCVGQDRGNFGQLESPRKDIANIQQALAHNIAEGLDHQVVQFVDASANSCRTRSGTIAGSHLDDTSRDGNNCIVGDTGNDGPQTYDGLISGTRGPQRLGRLDVRRTDGGRDGRTTCPGRVDLELDGVQVNNDVLSCFLRNGATLGTIAQRSGVSSDMLDPAVLASPRFVWMPVVYANDRSIKDFQPILSFAPGFITDETQVASQAASDASDCSSRSECNGLQINGSSVKTLTVFTFNPDALPVTEQSPTTAWSGDLGRKIVRLVG